MKIGLMRGTVALEPHDDKWESSAKEIIDLLKKILGNNVVDIQHIGSTSIKNIKSKPIIDIVVGVNDFEDILKYNNELSRYDIIFRGQDVERQLLYVMGDFQNDIRTHHIHVVFWNEKEWNNYINFRDYLNANICMAQEYSKLKEKLAKRYPNDRISYTNRKKIMIDKILKQAEEWRKSVYKD